MTHDHYLTLNVDLGERSYPIYIGAGILAERQLLTTHIPAKQILIVSHQTVADLYLHVLQTNLKDYQCDTLLLPEGEEFKTLSTVQLIFSELFKKHHHRTTTLIALGGGVIGDVTGFAAACYQRGVNFIQVPTTLLAQVDSSVGGKTGVNYATGKNMIGAFYQPRCVVSDTDTLRSLSARELSAGLAEVIKTALIQNSKFFTWLEQQLSELMNRDAGSLRQAIYQSCQIKATIISHDEKESGLRMLLNFGHSFAHAIEAGMGYGSLLHGEAVAIGMMIAANLSAILNLISKDHVQRIQNLLLKAQLPVCLPTSLSDDDLLKIMEMDKKNVAGSVRLVVLQAIGQAEIRQGIAVKLIKQAINQCY